VVRGAEPGPGHPGVGRDHGHARAEVAQRQLHALRRPQRRERRERAEERLEAARGETGGHVDHRRLGDAEVEEAVGVREGERVVLATQVRLQAQDPVVVLRQPGQRVPVGVASGGHRITRFHFSARSLSMVT
jgi:hypothetical protein